MRIASVNLSAFLGCSLLVLKVRTPWMSLGQPDANRPGALLGHDNQESPVFCDVQRGQGKLRAWDRET